MKETGTKMKREEFNLLLKSCTNKNWTDEYVAEMTSISVEEVKNTRNKLISEGLLTQDSDITQMGLDALKPYKVDNAVIMAAGVCKRCRPLSDIIPKGLFVVRGEVLIERQICQLKEAGVTNIIIVTGYKAEKFSYLKDKYDVSIVFNHEYMKKNNVSSIYAVRNLLGNSYICCADNYYAENVFDKYVYESFYICNYTENFADEYCITENEAGFIDSIKRGGSNQWYTIGANFWSKNFSEKFTELLEKEYSQSEIWNLLIDDFHIRHLSELPITANKKKPGIVFEFDTIPELEIFDDKFGVYVKEVIAENLYGRYNEVTRYAGVKTDNRFGRLHFNENLWGPSPNALIPLHEATLEQLYLYDSKQKDDLIIEISSKYNIGYDNIFLHNSGSEVVRSIMTIMIGENDNILLPQPHWSYYPGVVDYRFGNKIFYKFHEEGDKCYHDVDDLMEKAEQNDVKFIVVTSPAMPSGNLISSEDLERIIKYNPKALIFVDQAYFGFEDDEIDVNAFINKYDNVIFSRTFSKFFGLAGLRLGYGIASQRAMKALWLDLPLLALPIITRRAAIESLRDDAYYDRIREEIHTVKEWFYNELCKIDEIHPYRSDTNFIYMKVSDVDAVLVKELMEEAGYLFRIFEYDNKFYYRINVAPMDTMKDFISKLHSTIELAKHKYREEM